MEAEAAVQKFPEDQASSNNIVNLCLKAEEEIKEHTIIRDSDVHNTEEVKIVKHSNKRKMKAAADSESTNTARLQDQLHQMSFEISLRQKAAYDQL